MEQFLVMSALAQESKELASNSLRAARNLARLLHISSIELLKFGWWIMRFFLERPKLVLRKSPQHREEFEIPQASVGPFPFSHPPSRFF